MPDIYQIVRFDAQVSTKQGRGNHRPPATMPRVEPPPDRDGGTRAMEERTGTL
jgi:hypothetical protein